MFSIEIQTAGWILTKFGMEVALEGVRLLRFYCIGTANPVGAGPQKGVLGASEGSVMCFGKAFIKQKLQSAPI